MSQETVIFISLATLIASRHARAAFSEIAGVIPVQWNHVASANTSSNRYYAQEWWQLQNLHGHRTLSKGGHYCLFQDTKHLFACHHEEFCQFLHDKIVVPWCIYLQWDSQANALYIYRDTIIGERYCHISFRTRERHVKMVALRKPKVVRCSQSEHNLSECDYFLHW